MEVKVYIWFGDDDSPSLMTQFVTSITCLEILHSRGQGSVLQSIRENSQIPDRCSRINLSEGQVRDNSFLCLFP